MTENVRKLFVEEFNESNPLIYFSPGRVNIIGEHIDYNGGKVLPMAISLGIYGAISFNSSNQGVVVSSTFSLKKQFNVNDFVKDDSYLKYLKGIIYVLRKRNLIKDISGFNLLIYSTLPPSSGLSSSASLELLFVKMLNDHYNLELDDITMAKIAQEAEREYVLVNCGIMDQFAIAMGLKNHAIYLDTILNEDGKYINFNLPDATLVIINSNKPRNLVESKYNERLDECNRGLAIFQKVINKKCLCDYTLKELESNKGLFDEEIYRRLRHVISENERVIQALNAMEKADLVKLGTLLKASHQSLKDEYEVTGICLDTIYEELKKYPEVLGVRMTGAGFGGCLIALFKGNNQLAISKILDEINAIYFKITNLKFDYYNVESSDKTRRL